MRVKTKRNNRFFRTISLFTVFTIVIGMMTGIAAFAEDAEGITFAADTYYDMEKAITPNGSMTFEAVMTVPGTDDTSRHGWVIGNWRSYSLEHNSMGIELQANRKIRVFLCKGLKENTSVAFALPEEATPGTYRRLTFVLNVNGDISFYFDGTQVGETQNILSWMGDSPSTFYNQAAPFRIGGDYRSGNSWYLHDEKIKSIAMYKGVPTASDMTTTGLTAMFSYDLTNITTAGYLDDTSSNDNDAINPNVYQSTAEGATFAADTYYDMEKAITPNGSMTIETVMTIPGTDDTARHGWIIGNWESYDLENNSMGIELQANRKIRVFLCKGLKVNTSVVFDLPEEAAPGTYRKITFALNVNGDISFYVDGTQIGDTQNILDWMGDTPETFYNQAVGFRIGGDYRSGNSWYLHDEMVRSLAIYKGVPTVDNTGTTGITTAGLEPLCSYDLTGTSVAGYFDDLSTYDNDAINPNVYERPAEGTTFSSSIIYDMERVVTPNTSMTIEAVMTIPGTDDTSRRGNLIGNWKSWEVETGAINIELYTGRKARVFICQGLHNYKSLLFDMPEEASPGTYRKLTFVLNVNGDISFYVDGVQSGETQNILTWMGDSPETFFNQVTPFRIGGDYRDGNNWYLHDEKVKSLAIYKGVPTASDTGITTAGLEALCSYDLTDTSVVGYFDDLSSNDNNAINPNTYNYEREYDYSFAIVGDTQYMTRWDAAKLNGVQSSTQHLKKVYDWLLANANKKKIQYVMGLGDITDSYNKSYDTVLSSGLAFDTAAEWALAYEQISRLNGVIPYSVVRGNHDNETYFDKYFADNVADDDVTNTFYKSQFKDDDYEDNSVCFYDQNSALNAYTKFTAGTENYLLLLLDDNPTDAVLTWAGEVIERNPDYRVIINTHTYLGYTGDHIDDSETYTYAVKDLKDGENNGVQIWEKLVKKYENIVFVLCGHDYKAYNIVRKERIGDKGNIVNEMLICPQARDVNDDSDPKAGMVAMFYFSNGGKTVEIEYISTAASLATADGRDVYGDANQNNISFTIDPAIETKYGYIPGTYESATDYPLLVFDKDGTFETATAAWGTDGDATSAFGSAKSDGDVIHLRGDYSYNPSAVYNNLSQIDGTITLDLDGHTITCDSTKSPLFKAQAKTEYDSKIVVKDGTIKVGAYPVIDFSSWIGSAVTADSVKNFNFEFENVNFEFISGATGTNLVSAYTTAHEFATVNNVSFKNCTFDVTNAPSTATVFNCGDSDTKATANFKVTGGKFISDTADKINFYSIGNSNSSLTLYKLNGAYPYLQLPESVTAAPATALPTVEGAVSYTATVTSGLFELISPTGSLWDIETPVNVTSDGVATFKGTYYGSDTITLSLIAVSYVGNKLDKVDFMEKASITANTEVDLTATVDVASGATVKYFLWKGMDSMMPYVFK